MQKFEWNPEKEVLLARNRGVSMERVLQKLESNEILDLYDHPNQLRYPGQRIYVIDIDGYAWAVACIWAEENVFIKTIYPSRKLTRRYLPEGR